MPLDPPVISARAAPYGAEHSYVRASLAFPPRECRRPSLLALLACALVAGCGGGDDSGDQQAPPAGAAGGLPEARTGKTLAELLPETCRRAGRCWRRRASSSRTGKNRFGFALFSPTARRSRTRAWRVYVAPAGGGPAQRAVPGALRVAGGEAAVPEPPDGRPTRTRPSRSTSAKIPFEKPGQVRGARHRAAGREARGRRRSAAPAVVVKKAADDPIPAVGTAPPRIHTPTRGGRGRRRRLDRHPPAARRRCTTSTSPTCSARSRWCSCSPRRCCARAACAARSWTSPSR